MTKSLAGKGALVTGGSRGIGAASARALADEGANVAISYVASADKAEAVVKELKAKGVEARAFKADIVLLAGDTFDNHMVTGATIERAGRLLADAGLPVVILPGNHDPATPDSICFRSRDAFTASPKLRRSD